MERAAMPASSLHRTPAAADAPCAQASAYTLLLQDIHRLLVECAEEGMCGIDPEGRITFVNPALARMTGWNEEELIGLPHDAVVGHFTGCLEAVTPDTRVLRGDDAILLRKEGGSFPAAYTCTPVFRDHQLFATVVVFKDISEQRRAEEWEQNRSIIFSAILGNQELRPTLAMLADAFVARYPGRLIAILLRRDHELYLEVEAGWPRRTLPTVPISPDFHELLDPLLTPEAAPALQLCIASRLVSAAGEDWGTVAVFDREGGQLDDAVRGTIQRVCDLACVAIEHQQLYEEIAHRSESDPASVGPAHLFLEKCLEPAMVAARQRNKVIAVGCLYLDRLKQIMGTLGPEYGDAWTQAVSDRLNQCLRDVDIPLRYRGDSFLFALCDLNQASEAEEICHRLLYELRDPLLVKGHLLATTASIGISLFPVHGHTAGMLVRHAEIALDAVQQADRGGLLVYSAALGQQSKRAAEMPEALLRAIEHGQFHLAYQPLYNMARQIVGFEALLRWKHPEWGPITPAEFIPIAERTGLIVPIGDWVIHEVCRQAVAWGAHTLPGLRFFANVSGVQLERPDFASKIANTLRRSGLPPDRLELEITESWVISDLPGAASKLLSLRELGIGIAIDDFGTGHATFTYLQELPLDVIKIDRSFTHRLDGSDRPSTVRAITVMAQRLGLKIVAEGVETAEQAAELSAIGCDLMQGFYLSRPLLPNDAEALLKDHTARGDFAATPALLTEAHR